MGNLFFKFIADHVETNIFLRDDRQCQELVMEAMKYHLLPERRCSMQSPRTRPRKSTVGFLYAIGGRDCTKGILYGTWMGMIFGSPFLHHTINTINNFNSFIELCSNSEVLLILHQPPPPPSSFHLQVQ